ncbi:MAG: RDD family protein [Bacilli bacterium]|jgi:hypothetical protein
MAKKEKTKDANLLHPEKKAKKGKRILIAFLDFVFVIVLMSIVSTAAGIPIANKVGLAEAGQKVNFMTNDSGLFILNEQKNYELISNDSHKPEALYRYYVGFNGVSEVNKEERYSSGTLSPRLGDEEVNTAELYYTKILLKGEENCPFDFSGTINAERPWRIKVQTGKEDEAKSLYAQEFDKAYESFLLNEDLQREIKKSSNMLLGALVISFYVSAFFLIAIFPLFFKDGKTLAMLITKTSLTNMYGFKITKGQSFLKGISRFALYYLFFFLPLQFISFLILIFSKSRRSLTDLIAGTDIVPDTFIIYKDANALYEYNVKLAKAIAKQEERRKELLANEKNIEIIE